MRDFQNVVLTEVAAGLSDIEDLDGIELIPGYSYPFTLDQTADLFVTRQASACPGALDELNDITSQFPDLLDELDITKRPIMTSDLLVPLIGIQLAPNMGRLARGNSSTILEKVDELSQMPPSYGLVVMDDTADLDCDFPNNERNIHIYDANLTDRMSINNKIYDDLEGLVQTTLKISFQDLSGSRQLIENIHNKIFHYNEVLRVYYRNQVGMLTILIQIYFERYYHNQLYEYLHSIRNNKEAGDIIDENDTFKKIIDYCRYFGIMSDNDYRIVNNLRSYRNDYAHDLSYHNPEKQVDVKSDQKLREAIELYESLIEVDMSILD